MFQTESYFEQGHLIFVVIKHPEIIQYMKL